MANRSIFFTLILNCCITPLFSKASATDIKVGILGDSHGQKDAVSSAFRRMRKEGVSHLIVLGDIVPWNLKNPEELRPILESIKNESGLPKDKIFFAIGNAEEDVLAVWIPKKQIMEQDGVTESTLFAAVKAETLDYEEMREKYYTRRPFRSTPSYQMFKEYGVLTQPSPDDYSYLKVGGKRIAFSHYNKRKLPDDLLQPTKFRMEHTEDPSRLRMAFPEKADIAFYGDIHIGGYYWDRTANKLIVNPGVLNAKAKDAEEPQAYSIYNVTRDEVTFWDSKSDQPLLNANLSDIKTEARHSCNVIFKKLASALNH